jgi:dCTP deaminase
MAFLGNKSLETLLKGGDVITPFYPSAIKNGAYELSLGSQVFLTDSLPKKVKDLTTGEQVTLSPGQFALLLTEETVNIPMDKMAFISIKASVKYKGLINVSGFHVDAGFKGKLLFSVYNAGSSQIILSRGSKYFPIWFADLDSKQTYHGIHEHQQRIPDEPVEDLSQGEMTSPASLSIKIETNHDLVMKEINLLERDQKAKNYLAAVALGLVLTLFVKLGFDWMFATSAVSREQNLRQNELVIDSTIRNLLIQKRNLLVEIDSLEKIKTPLLTSQKDTSNGHH